VVDVLNQTKAGIVHTFNETIDTVERVDEITHSFFDILQSGPLQPQTDCDAF